jgi:flagellar hook-associated protein 3 FlgL
MDTSRITQQSVYANTFDYLSQSLTKYQDIQQELASGKVLTRPSDSPQGMVSSLRYRGDMARVDQFQKNIQDGLSWLGTADQTLTSVVDQVQSVRNAIIQGQNANLDQAGREALAQQVDQARESLISLANTQYLGRPIFGGTAGGDTAYDSSGSFLGNTGSVARSIGFNQTVDVNVSGPSVFGDSATGLFATLTQISSDLRTNPSNLPSDMTALDANVTNVQNAQSIVGARYNRLSTTKSRNDDLTMQMKQGLSDIEDVDLPKTIVDLQTQEIAYQAALAATSKVITPSLVDFLR